MRRTNEGINGHHAEFWWAVVSHSLNGRAILRRMRFARLFAALVLMLAALTCLSASPALANRQSRTTPLVRVVKQTAPMVVNISTTSRQRMQLFHSGDEFFDRFFEDFFGPRERQQTSLGSGVIIDGKRGLIATNRHVVSRATTIKVQLADRRVFKAELVGADAESDLAVLKIKTKSPLPQAALGDSSDIMIGEQVIAIGNPFGLGHSVTVGVVSALNRRVRAAKGSWLGGLIQTDASINPGNSGGPLLNADGELVGINAAIYRQAQGIGFAIPINRVKRVINDLVRYGEVVPNWLGLYLQDLDPRLAAHFGLDRPRGAIVLGAMGKSPADKAGLKRGDVILKADGMELEDSGHYRSWLAGLPVGKKIALTYLRSGKTNQARLTVSAFPLERSAEVAWDKWGFSLAPLDAATAARHGVRPGSALKIARLKRGAAAEQIGLRMDDLILQVGNVKIKTLKSFYRQVAKRRLQNSITVLVRRGRARQFVTLGM